MKQLFGGQIGTIDRVKIKVERNARLCIEHLISFVKFFTLSFIIAISLG